MRINAINNVYNSRNTINFNRISQMRETKDEIILSASIHHKEGTGILQKIKTIALGKLAYDPIKQSVYYQKHGKISKDIRIADGFKDMGKSGSIAKNGKAKSHREIIVVDRKRDYVLQEMTDYVKDNTRGMDENEKVRYLSDFIQNVESMIETKNKGRFPQHNQEVLLGHSVINRYAEGRHNALFFKIIGDEIGIKNDLIKGTLAGCKHAWNVVHYEDGRKVIHDCTSGVAEDAKSSFVYRQAK